MSGPHVYALIGLAVAFATRPSHAFLEESRAAMAENGLPLSDLAWTAFDFVIFLVAAALWPVIVAARVGGAL